MTTTPSNVVSLDDDDYLLGSEELAAWLDVPVRTLDSWAYRGVGPAPTRVGRFRRYRKGTVRAWLREQERKASA